jgi:hypothetical protein
VLFSALTIDGRYEARILDRNTGEVHRTGVQGRVSRYVESGHLVFIQSRELLAIPFDLETLTASSRAERVVSGVHETERGDPYFAVGRDGTLVYEPVRPPQPGQSLVWVDREGTSTPIAEGRGFEFPSLSPTGTRITVQVHAENNLHAVYVLDSQGGPLTPVTHEGNHVQGIWSPDESELIYSRFGGDMQRRRLPSGVPETVIERAGWQWPLAWPRDDLLLFMEVHLVESGNDVLALNLRDGTVEVLLGERFNESAGTFSPDGTWLAYVSDETGTEEIYLRTREGTRKALVSTSGGTEPRWSPLGGELFFRHGNEFFAIDVPADPDRPIGTPHRLFSGSFRMGFENCPNYDVHPDGDRFVMVAGGGGLTAGRLDVFLDFARFLADRQGTR